MISRMVDQKGFDLLGQISEACQRLGASFVLLGSGEPRYEAQWRELAESTTDRIGVRIGFDDALGASDGRRGRYVPDAVTVRAVRTESDVQPPIRDGAGGSRDRWGSLTPSTMWTTSQEEGQGLRSLITRRSALLGALGRALQMFENRPAWRRIQEAGMREDFSWDASARVRQGI